MRAGSTAGLGAWVRWGAAWLVLAFAAAWVASGVTRTYLALAPAPYARILRSAPEPGIGGAFALVSAAERTRPGPVGVVWLLPDDRAYWRYFFEYHFLPGRVTFYPDLPAAAAAAPAYILVVGPPADVPAGPPAYELLGSDRTDLRLVIVYSRSRQ